MGFLFMYAFAYASILSQQPACDTLSPEDIKHDEHVRTSIQVVTRAYEEKYLREPLKKERACIMAEQCQGLVMKNIFVAALLMAVPAGFAQSDNQYTYKILL
jgi:hypothetical protein